MTEYDDYIARIREAIKDGSAKQVRIAEYCGVSEQAVARWKTTGQISKENLYSFSEITGFRYRYLKFGEPPKLITTNAENRKDYMVAENAGAYLVEAHETINPELSELFESLKLAVANKSLTQDAIVKLTAFVKALNS